MRPRERGSVSVEHAGLYLFVALLMAALLGGDVATQVASGARSAVCAVLAGCDADGGSVPGAPAGAPDTSLSPSDLPGPDASPEEVHAFFASLTDAQREELVRAHPELIGPMAGAPVEMRYEANLILMERALPSLRAERDAAAEALEDARADFARWGWIPHLRGVLAGRVVGRARELELAEAKLALTEEWAASDRQFLLYDPAGDGKVVEVIGDLASAEHVAMFVPGMANDISDFESMRTRGVNLQQAVAESGDEDVASIIWLGYDPPDDPRERLIDIVGTVGSGPARAGGEDLPPFVAGILADRDRHLTVVSHSYGTIVAGYGLRNGVDAEDVIFAGSPGVDADTAAELAHGYTPWAAQTEDDLIDNVPNVRVLGGGHGRDPTDPAFGAEVFDTGTASGHSEYFKPGTESLRNIARIVTGRYDDVTLCEEVGCPGYP
jgi:Alpha/beta hydrolase